MRGLGSGPCGCEKDYVGRSVGQAWEQSCPRNYWAKIEQGWLLGCVCFGVLLAGYMLGLGWNSCSWHSGHCSQRAVAGHWGHCDPSTVDIVWGNGLACFVVGNCEADCRDSQSWNYQLGNEMDQGNAGTGEGGGNEEGDCPSPVGIACDQGFSVAGRT